MTPGENSLSPHGRPVMTRGAVFWTAVILVATLFPYDPAVGPSWGTTLARFDWAPFDSTVDFLANILLFLPWGFCLAGRSGGNRRRVAVTLLLGAALSVLVEFLQLGLPSRNPTLADILANLLGTAAGVGLAATRGQVLRSFWARAAAGVGRILTVRVLVVLLVVDLVLVFGLLRLADQRSSLDDWDTACHLNLGNETTGNRPWTGNLGQVRLWGSVLPPEMIGQLSVAEDPGCDPDRDLLWSFDPVQASGDGGTIARDPDLVWRPSAPADGSRDAVHLSADHWLTSDHPASGLTAALRKTGKFTLSAAVQTGDTAQTGPGRIVSLSIDPLHRNFTLGQEGPDLVFRLRTPFTGPNGSEPALIVPGVFSETGPRTVVVTYDGSTVTVHPGAGDPPARLCLRYAGVFTGLGFGFNEADQTGYRIVFWGLLWLPPLVIVGRLVRMRRG